MSASENEAATTAADYDGFAAAYSARNEKNLFNAYYERPEMIRLAGDVARLEILDAGCGSGALTEALRAKGAVVSGFDLSPAMVELARQRLGEDADLRVADLGAPLPYPDDKFDLVVSSLSLHYVTLPFRPAGVIRVPQVRLPRRRSIPATATKPPGNVLARGSACPTRDLQRRGATARSSSAGKVAHG